MPIEIRHLKAAVATADVKSFSRAAKVLCVKQSALSRRVQALEQMLGVQLFERTKRGTYKIERTATNFTIRPCHSIFRRNLVQLHYRDPFTRITLPNSRSWRIAIQFFLLEVRMGLSTLPVQISIILATANTMQMKCLKLICKD